MLLRLILVLAAMTAMITMTANALVMPPNIATGLARSVHERTPLPPHEFGLHIPNTTNPRNTYSASDMKYFLDSHLEALDMCAMVVDAAMEESHPDKESPFDRIFRRWFAKEDRDKVLGQSSANARLEARRLTFRRCLHGYGRLKWWNARPPEVGRHLVD
jgi:hypothetical protein